MGAGEVYHEEGVGVDVVFLSADGEGGVGVFCDAGEGDDWAVETDSFILRIISKTRATGRLKAARKYIP